MRSKNNLNYFNYAKQKLYSPHRWREGRGGVSILVSAMIARVGLAQRQQTAVEMVATLASLANVRQSPVEKTFTLRLFATRVPENSLSDHEARQSGYSRDLAGHLQGHMHEEGKCN